MLVDEIGDVVAVEEEQLEPTPATLPYKIGIVTESVCRHHDKLMLILDIEQVIRLASGMEAEF